MTRAFACAAVMVAALTSSLSPMRLRPSRQHSDGGPQQPTRRIVESGKRWIRSGRR
jgi:hypothetical protein